MMITESQLIDVETNTKNTKSPPILYNEIINFYEAEEASVNIEYVLDKVTYLSPVNFRESMHSIRHRWFPYKEGFSPSFVKSFIQEHAPKNAQNILDPFSGVGTTLLEGSRLGLSAFGFEVSPMSSFIAESKSMSFDLQELSELDTWIERLQLSPLTAIEQPPLNATVVSYFEPSYLEALLRLKAFYKKIDNLKVKALFKLSFLSCLEQFSTHRKAGNGVKRKTKLPYIGSLYSPIEQIRIIVLQDLQKFRKDLKSEPTIKPYSLINGSCLDTTLYPEGIRFDTVLTSPPYANCFDYSKIYMVELWLGDFFIDGDSQKEFRKQSIRSHVHARWASRYSTYGSELINNQVFEFLSIQELWSKQIPSMLKGYFADLGYLLSILSQKCNEGATVGIVVGNSYYGTLPIATDLLISNLGRKHGFEPIKITVYRNIISSSQQFTRASDKKYMRESLVILKKK